MSSGMKHVSAFATLAFCLAGCAGEMQSRQLSGQTAAVLNDYRREMENFATGQTSLNAQNDARIIALNGNSFRSRAYVTTRLTAFKTAEDTSALNLYEGVAGRSIDEIIKSSAVLNSLEPPPASATASFEGASVNAVVKQLKTLEKRPDFLTRLKAGLAYYNEMQAAQRKALEEADQDTADSGNSAIELDGVVAPPKPEKP